MNFEKSCGDFEENKKLLEKANEYLCKTRK